MASAKTQPGLSGPRLVYWGNREARRLQVGEQPVILTPDMATIMDCLLEAPSGVVPPCDIIYALYGAQNRQEPEGAAGCLRTRVTLMRDLGLDINYIHGAGYCIGVPFNEYEAGEVYRGRDEFGDWRLVKIYQEPMLLLQSMADPEREQYLSLTAARHWKLERTSHEGG